MRRERSLLRRLWVLLTRRVARGRPRSMPSTDSFKLAWDIGPSSLDVVVGVEQVGFRK